MDDKTYGGLSAGILLIGALTRESEGSPFASQPQKSDEKAPGKEPFSDDRSE